MKNQKVNLQKGNEHITKKELITVIVVLIVGIIILGGSCVGCMSCMSCINKNAKSSNNETTSSMFNVSSNDILTDISISETTESLSKSKSDKLKTQYSFYEKSAKEICKEMKVTQDQADDIFIILVENCGLDGAIRDIYTTNKGETYFYYWEGSAKTQEITLENGIVTEVKYGFTVLYPQNSSESETSSENSSESESTYTNSNVPEPRETATGKSDKVFDFTNSPALTVPNDVTGNWRYLGFSESDIDISEYALDYYHKYFTSDNEIHAVINFANKTTTRISYTTGMLFVTVLEYVDGEEHDANKMFSGKTLQDFIVYTNNGDIEPLTEELETLDISEPAQIETNSVTSVENNDNWENHFNDYNTPEQQNTTQIVLNTSTKKYHYPSCSEVVKIKPENYATIGSESEAIAQGYTACKRCH